MKSRIILRECFAFLIITLIGCTSTIERNNNLTYDDIVHSLYNMKNLAIPPEIGEQSGSFSSWNRDARYDESTGLYVKWYANRDGAGFMDDQGTMMEIEGPGVVWRIWSAYPKEGIIEFYIDGQETATVSMPFIDLFNNKEPPFNYPELVHTKAEGHNFFIPIPFQKSIRIRGGEGWGICYQITYSRFPDGTTVPSFTGEFTETDKAALQTVNDIWKQRGPNQFISDNSKAKTVSIEIESGQEKLIANYYIPAAITSINLLRPEMTREESLSILRELTISITWDDDVSPSVWAPIGDFFGTGAGENLYRTLATGMTDSIYYCNWYMPFEKAVIKVRNDGKTTRTLNFTLYTERLNGNADNLLRYHFKWHRDDFSGFDKESLMSDRWPDWPVIKVENAKGRFAGFHTHVWNPNHNWFEEHQKYVKPLPESKYFENDEFAEFFQNEVAKHYWWGEGDEKFFVDGEKMPSTFGTGTEDYFGYAFGTSEAYESALQAQPRNGTADTIGEAADRAGPGNIGHIVMVRWQIADNVPFQNSFEAVIEKYHGNNWPLLNAYGVSWYQSPGSEDYYQVVPVEDRVDYYMPAIEK